jgi:ABC-type antimicrobial peptide transport system permease subunit
MRRFAEIGVSGRYEGGTIFGIHPRTRMRRPTMRAGRFLGDDATEVVLTQDLARRLRVGVGEPVSVRVRHGEEYSFHVVGISGEITPAQVVMSFRQAQVITNFKDEASGVYVDTSGPAPALESTLASLAYVGKITNKGDIVAAHARLMSEMMRIVYLATAVSVFVAALFVFMSVNLSVTERLAEYAMFQCLGYDRRRMRGMILTEAFGEGLLAALASIPIGIALARLLNARMGEAWYEVITVFSPGDFATVLVGALGLLPLAAFPGLRIIAHLDIVTALRTRTFE